MILFVLNNEIIKTKFPSGYVLLDFLRKVQRLTGTKEGCREGDCGACTVLVGELINGSLEYKTVNSCLYPLGDANLKHIVTIEGLNVDGLNYLQERFVIQGGTQCGFCTPGFIVSSIGYFLTQKKIDIDTAIEFIGGNICRCTGYAGIKRSLADTIKYLGSVISKNGENKSNNIEELVRIKFLPDYFLSIPEKLKQLKSEIALPTQLKLVSGGTDLYVQQWEELVDKEIYLLSNREDLRGITISNNQIHIGGATTISEIENSEIIHQHIPELQSFLKLFGSKQIRNRATIAGNIVNASPIADMVNILLVLDAKLYIESNEGIRTVYLKDFYKGYKQIDKTQNEIIKTISFKIPFKNYLFNFEKISRRTYLDIASVNSSFFGYIDHDTFTEVHISAGGVAPIPLYLKETSSFFKGRKISQETISRAAEIALTEISPISDARGSADYKRLLLRQLIFAHFEKFFPDLLSIDLITQEDQEVL